MKIAVNVARLFPAIASQQWPFIERGTLQKVDFAFAARELVVRREIELNGTLSFLSRPFFDRFAVTDAGLEITRVSVHPQPSAINPPLVVTAQDHDDHIARLLPNQMGYSTFRPPYDGTAHKTAALIEIKGFPGKFVEWAVRLVSKDLVGTLILDATLTLLEGVGITSYIGRWAGSYFVFERQGEMVPTPPDTPEPPDGIQTKLLFGFEDNRDFQFKPRTGTSVLALHVDASQDHTYSYRGSPGIFPLTLKIGDPGTYLLAISLWDQVLLLPSPILISRYRLGFEPRPEFLFNLPRPAIKGPGQEALDRLAVRVTWSKDGSEVPWAQSASGPYAGSNEEAYYLLVDAQATAASGKLLAPYHEVIVFSERMGPIRICRMFPGASPAIWDLVAHS
jgi:hypothetical protein